MYICLTKSFTMPYIQPYFNVKTDFPFLNEWEGFDLYDDWEDRDLLVVFEKDVVMDGPFYWDIFDDDVKGALLKHFDLKVSTDRPIQGLVFLGNLTVNGSVINAEGDYGPFVYVKGNIACQSLLLGGAYVVVEGDIVAQEVVMTDYNHGFLNCNGVVSAPVFIVEDHSTYFKRRENILFYYNSKTDEDFLAENDCYEDEETEEWLISPKLQALLVHDSTAFEELKRDLAQGEWVLKSGILPDDTGISKVENDYAYWLKKVGFNYRDLKRVPARYKDLDLCLFALQKSYAALKDVPLVYITDTLCMELVKADGFALQVIPHDFLTVEICEMAALKGTSLGFIPEKFYSEALILSVMKNSRFEPDMTDVPASFITPALLVAYLKLGKGLYLDKVCKTHGLNKQEILFTVIDDGVEWVDCIFSHHCSKETIAYAKQRYDNEVYAKEWADYMTKFREKLERYAK